MSKPVFYQAILTKLDNDEVLNITKGIPINERTENKDGSCPECGDNHWWLYPMKSATRRDGKAYMECLNCGYITHL